MNDLMGEMGLGLGTVGKPHKMRKTSVSLKLSSFYCLVPLCLNQHCIAKDQMTLFVFVSSCRVSRQQKTVHLKSPPCRVENGRELHVFSFSSRVSRIYRAT